MKKIFKSSLFPIILLILISSLSHRVWFDPFAVLTSGDIWFLYKESLTTSNWGTWASYLFFGDVNIGYNMYFLTLFFQLVAKLGGTLQTVNQIIYFFPIVIIAPVASYLYLNRLTHSRVASFVGSIFYIFTTIFLILQNGGLLLAVAYAFTPLVFYYFDKYLVGRQIQDGLLFIFIFSLIILYELRIAYLIGLVLIGYTFFRLWMDQKKSFILEVFHFFKTFSFLLVIFLGINAYIYFPIIFTTISSSAGNPTARSLFGSEYFTFYNPFVGMHPFWTGGTPTEFIVQPIPIYFWLFPIFAFASIIFIKKNKLILFFLLIALISVFLGKSAAPPFGSIYLWLYNNFPGFNFFREPSKLWIIIAFSYSVLITYTIAYGLQLITRFKKKRFLFYIFSVFLIFPIILGSLYTGRSAFSSELGDMFRSLTLTKEHEYLKDFITKQNNYFRTLYIPYIYRLGYASEIHPMLGLYSSPLQFQNLDPQLLSLQGVKYVVLPADLSNDIYRYWGDKQIFKNMVAESPGLKKIEDPHFGEFEVYENSLAYKPHFYLSKNIVSIEGESSNLASIMSLVTTEDPTFYFLQNTQSIDTIDSQTIDKINYDNSSEVFVSSPCIRCQRQNYLSTLSFPWARFLPDSPFYGYIVDKEQKHLLSIQGDPGEYAKNAAYYGMKRIVELQRIAETKAHDTYAYKSALEQNKLLNQLQVNLPALAASNPDNSVLLTILDYLQAQAEVIYYLLTFDEDSYFSDDTEGMLQDNYLLILSLKEEIQSKTWVSDNNSDRYIISVTNPGMYDVYVPNSKSITPSSVRIDDTTIENFDSNNGWFSAGAYNFDKKSYKIEVNREKKNYASSSTIQLNTIGSNPERAQVELNDLEKNNEYLISFEYKISKKADAQFYIDKKSDVFSKGYKRRTLFTFLTADEGWHTYESNFATKIGDKNSLLNFSLLDGAKPAEMEIRNISVTNNSPSNIILRRTKEPTQNLGEKQPTITFQWINPTKYKLHVDNASSPFYLTFAEQYNPGWEAEYTESVGSLQGEQVGDYESGTIKEIKGKNNIDISTATDVFKKNREIVPVHFSVNSYANAWYIDRKGEYDIEVTFASQKIFMVGFIISVISLIAAVLLLLILVLKKYLKNEKNKK